MTVNPDGTKTVSYTKGGYTTTKVIDANGKVLEESTTPYVKISDTSDDGVTITQESPMSISIKEPVKKATTYTFNDGQEYTGYETNWEDAAKKTGNTSGLKGAITYPDYVDNNEAWRYLNEMADTYGVELDKPVGGSVTYSKDDGVNIIPDYNAPFGQPSFKVGDLGTGANGANSYRGFDYRPYYDSARENAYKKYETDRQYADMYYDSLAENEDEDYVKRQQQAYLANYFANKKAQDALLENGIKGGLAETSILKGEANFENNYNENFGEHIEYLRNIEQQRAKAYAEMTEKLNEYFAQLDLKEAEMMQEENENYNDYALKAYMAQIEKQEAERERAFKAQQAEAERQHEMELKMLSLK